MIATIPSPSLESRFFTPAQVADILGVSEWTVDQWLRRRELGCFKLGRIIRISREGLLDFIFAHWRVGRGAGMHLEASEALRRLLDAAMLSRTGVVDPPGSKGGTEYVRACGSSVPPLGPQDGISPAAGTTVAAGA